MNTEETTLFDTSFESTTQQRRWHLLPSNIHLINLFGLLFGLYYLIAILVEIPHVLQKTGSTGQIENMVIAVIWITVILKLLPILLMHLLLIFEWKWAIRFCWVGLGAVVLLVYTEIKGASLGLISMAMYIVYIHYFIQLFKVRQKWEMAAITRWNKKAKN
ncbi:hypothetical protein CLV59_106130 [Chitinophaga dinghuensis]|uniref:Uncharacterized protein n=1 Tax=Chitinophaga dinghuensis TaxID=1539050 RepID=A0A327VUZ2_9BACT|nr:hypothetical protein [Chitinophaga dinghuensis]RAJ79070.1 hypothetical protein CLV59_106130 [Chitinophaga dinghuensis]